ncbi:MAG TPA: FAD-dependent oxidoreductase [Pseudonocardiaceae bacterium]|jgi:FAD/FMN-containing dehydrogenase|nr:FAD-dependent oxidoreductase [Pseudonocardiaceae bacterium]
MVDRRTFLRAGIGAIGLAAVGAALPSASSAAAANGADGASGVRALEWERLRRCLRGDLVLPGDSDYTVAKQLDAGRFDSISPAAIAYAEDVEDVRDCLRFAQHNDIALAVRSGGHSAAGYSTTTGLVLDVSRFNSIDVGASTVAIGPGVQGVDLLTALAPHGLSAVTGNCPTVCAGGYLQGGGIGPQMRKFGVASDHLVSAEVVLADGRLVHCSATREPELFWALRGGGGGNFGVVTRYEIRPTNVTNVVTFSLIWPWAAAADVIAAHLPWAQQAPDDLIANLTVIEMNPAAGGAPTVMLTGDWFGADPNGLTPLLDELVAAVGTAPVSRTTNPTSYHTAMMQQFNCATKTVQECHRTGSNPEALLPRDNYMAQRGRLLAGPLDGTAINELLTAFEATPSTGQLRLMSWGLGGGAVNRVPRTATAYVHRTSQHYFTFAAGLFNFTATPDQQSALDTWVDRGFAVAQRYGDGEDQVNFIDSRLTDWRGAYYAENYGRLLQVKRRYDPYRFFSFAQGIGS